MSARPKEERQEAYRHVPYDIEVEQALLGTVLVDNQALASAAAILKPEQFYDPLHARIFAAMVQMIDTGVGVTPLTLRATIKSDPGVIELGVGYFEEMRKAAPAQPNIRDYANFIADLAQRRCLISIGENIVKAAHEAPTERPTTALIEAAEMSLRCIAEQDGELRGDALGFIEVRTWEGTTAPVREWAVPNRIPARCPTLLSGEGAVGKTLLAEQLAVATPLGKEWFGVVPRPGPAMIICCEDDEDEMHRRFERIAEYYQAPFSALSDLHPLSLVGKDATFAAPNARGVIEPTPLFRRVLRAAKAIRPSILILDNSADIYAGNENDRAQVRRFVTLLTEIAIEANCGLLLTSHPSLSGISTGSGISGSTAWHASVRARLYMRKAKADGEDAADPDERVLEVMKSNYGPPGESINLRWENGLFVPIESPHWIDKRAAADGVDELFLRLLQRFNDQGRNVSHKKTAHGYAPTEFAKDPEGVAACVRKAALADAMHRLFAAKRIHVETYGRPSRPYTKLAVGAHP